MIVKLFYILLIHFIFCKAEPRQNTAPVLPYIPDPRTGNLNNGLDCRPASPEQRSDQNQGTPLSTNGLVPQSLKDQSELRNQNQYVYTPKKPLNDQTNEVDESRKQPLNRDSEVESRNGKKQPLKESNPAELGKLVEKCLTSRLAKQSRSSRPSSQLDSQELLNTRRSNPSDSSLDDDSFEAQSRNDSPSEVDESLADPTQVVGLRRLSNPNSNLVLANNRKVCYACTSANNPSCWTPDRQTTVKYCNRANDACVTKTYNAGQNKVVIRDCGNSCSENVIGVHPEFTSCSVCHSNLCNDSNGAFNLHINLHSFILGLILVALVKRVV